MNFAPSGRGVQRLHQLWSSARAWPGGGAAERAARRIGIRIRRAAEGGNELIAGSVLVGFLRHVLSGGVTLVNARRLAADRGIDVVETRSARTRRFTSLLSLKLHTSEGERWVEGTIFEQSGPRLVLLDGIAIEAPLAGALIVIRNQDTPGVIGEVGSVLGKHGVNIANFALGRDAQGAIGVVNVDESGSTTGRSKVLDALTAIPAIRDARLIRV